MAHLNQNTYEFVILTEKNSDWYPKYKSISLHKKTAFYFIPGSLREAKEYDSMKIIMNQPNLTKFINHNVI